MIDRFRGKYYFLSNFYPCTINYNGLTFNSVEAAYQAQKNLKESYKFINLSASEAKYLGKKVKIRQDWNIVKDYIMKDLVMQKFIQNKYLKEKLLETNYEELIEGNDWGDKYWGKVNGVGENKLGIILQQCREELRNKPLIQMVKIIEKR